MADETDPYKTAESDVQSLTGADKAAIFLLSIGEEHSSLLFERMEDEEGDSSGSSS